MSNTNEDYELNYYLSIIDFFQKENTNPETIELWRNKSFMQLMRVLKRTRRKEFVKNAIILILSLFDELPPDSFNNKGIKTSSLTNGDKLSYVDLLKSEFLNDVPN